MLSKLVDSEPAEKRPRAIRAQGVALRAQSAFREIALQNQIVIQFLVLNASVTCGPHRRPKASCTYHALNNCGAKRSALAAALRAATRPRGLWMLGQALAGFAHWIEGSSRSPRARYPYFGTRPAIAINRQGARMGRCNTICGHARRIEAMDCRHPRSRLAQGFRCDLGLHRARETLGALRCNTHILNRNARWPFSRVRLYVDFIPPR